MSHLFRAMLIRANMRLFILPGQNIEELAQYVRPMENDMRKRLLTAAAALGVIGTTMSDGQPRKSRSALF